MIEFNLFFYDSVLITEQEQRISMPAKSNIYLLILENKLIELFQLCQYWLIKLKNRQPQSPKMLALLYKRMPTRRIISDTDVVVHILGLPAPKNTSIFYCKNCFFELVTTLLICQSYKIIVLLSLGTTLSISLSASHLLSSFMPRGCGHCMESYSVLPYCAEQMATRE